MGSGAVSGVPDRKKGGSGREPLSLLCRNLGLHSGRERGKCQGMEQAVGKSHPASCMKHHTRI